VTENYAYDANGNMINIPHLSKVRCDCTNQLRSSSQRIRADGIPETTWYVYDSSGQRVRKATERQTATSDPSSATKMQERLVVDGLDIYRQYSGDGETITQ
jgi:YD repeat-containing protein